MITRFVAEPDVGFVEFRRPSEGYRIERPAGWEETGASLATMPQNFGHNSDTKLQYRIYVPI